MVRTWILIALISCLVVSVVGKKKSAAEQSQEKVEQRNRVLSTLLSSTSTSPSSVVYLGDGNFTKFVVERPREYFAFMLFTATAAQYQCSVCVKTKQTFIDAANHYSNQYEFDTTPADRRIVFFVLEVDSARSVFSDMQLETVPRVYMLPPTTSKTPKSKISDFEVESRILLEGTASILGEVRSLTGVEVKILLDPAPALLGLCLVALLVALFVSGAASDVLGSLLWYQSPKIWVVVSSVRFSIATSAYLTLIMRPPGSSLDLLRSGRERLHLLRDPVRAAARSPTLTCCAESPIMSRCYCYCCRVRPRRLRGGVCGPGPGPVPGGGHLRGAAGPGQRPGALPHGGGHAHQAIPALQTRAGNYLPLLLSLSRGRSRPEQCCCGTVCVGAAVRHGVCGAAAADLERLRDEDGLVLPARDAAAGAVGLPDLVRQERQRPGQEAHPPVRVLALREQVRGEERTEKGRRRAPSPCDVM